MNIDQLTQKAVAAYEKSLQTHDAYVGPAPPPVLAVIAAVLAEVRQCVPEEPEGEAVVYRLGWLDCRAEMLRRLDAMEGK